MRPRSGEVIAVGRTQNTTSQTTNQRNYFTPSRRSARAARRPPSGSGIRLRSGYQPTARGAPAAVGHSLACRLQNDGGGGPPGERRSSSEDGDAPSHFFR